MIIFVVYLCVWKGGSGVFFMSRKGKERSCKCIRLLSGGHKSVSSAPPKGEDFISCEWLLNLDFLGRRFGKWLTLATHQPCECWLGSSERWTIQRKSRTSKAIVMAVNELIVKCERQKVVQCPRECKNQESEGDIF